MLILGIETSTLTGSVALLSDGNVLGEITLSVKAQHSERLMPAIQELLRDAGVKAADVDLYAVSQGPGSFTGLRIGIAAAQGLAMAHGRPIVGVPTLESLAMNAVYFPGLIIPMLNAFRGEAYWGIYQSKDPGMVRLRDDEAASPQAIVEVLKDRSEKIVFLGNGVEIVREAIEQFLPADRILFAPPSVGVPRASHIALLAGRKSSIDRGQAVLPRYLRKAG